MGGGKYTATQNSDGTWNILDVPICGEIPEAHLKTHPWNGKPIDLEWMIKTVENHQRRFKENEFCPPLHVDHHGDAIKNEKIGKFLPTRVGKMRYEGKETNVILADFIAIPDDVLLLFEKEKLPYISIEAASWDDAEFTSCAVMSDKSPYFRFPNLTIGSKVYAPAAAAEMLPAPVGMSQAYVGTQGGLLVLCKAFTGIKLADDGSEEKDEEKPAEKPADEKTEEAEEKPAAAAATPAGDPQAQILAFLQRMDTTLTLIAKNFTGVGGADSAPTDENKAPVEQEKPMTEEKKDKPAAASDVAVKLAALEKANAELTGKVAGLLDKDAERAKRDSVTSLASKYEVELAGYHLTETTRKTIALMAEKGEDALKAFVETYKTTVPKDPPTTLADYEGQIAAGAVDTDAQKVLARFQARGPEALEKAKGFIGLWHRTKEAGRTRLGCEAFVDAQFMGEAAVVTVNGLAR